MSIKCVNYNLEIENNFLNNNIMENQIEQVVKRRRGRPSKPSKVDVGVEKLKEIPIDNYVSKIYKQEIIHLFKNNKLTFKTGQNLINSLHNITRKKLKTLLNN